MLNYSQLRSRCLSPLEDFLALGKVEYTHAGPYVYLDRGGSVLGVAHLDTVQARPAFSIGKKHKKPAIFSPWLDDRLGAYILLDYLPTLGVTADVLLSVGEEHGMPSSEWFEPEKDYNWMFSFDRAGNDVVLYQYDDSQTRAILEGHGFKIGRGIFSDVGFMDHLGIKGINFGTGYYDYHSPNAYCLPRVTERMVYKFVGFWLSYADSLLAHDSDFADEYRFYRRQEREYEDLGGEDLEASFCDFCGLGGEGIRFRRYYDAVLCEYCFEEICPYG